MLAPDSRTVAVELLRPPPGYRLDLAVLTTYTLDLEALLALPLAVLAHADAGVEELLRDPLMLLEALREAGNRVHVFVDACGVSIPHVERPLYSLLEASVHPVRAPGGGAFHPKVWLARFTAPAAPTRIRVAVLSRNLTFDRSWDVALSSEAEPAVKQRAAATGDLGELLVALPRLCHEHALPAPVGAAIAALADDVKRTRFPAPEAFDQPIVFHALGLTGKRTRAWTPQTGGSRMLAVAPFVNRTALDALRNACDGACTLVSRQEELDKLPVDALSDWSTVLVLSDAAQDELEDGANTRPSGLHAKLIAVESGWDVTWYAGSANLTAAGFTGSNVEMMAAITGRKGRRAGNSGCGIERFMESGFASLCMPYARRERDPEAPDVREAREHIEAARDAIVAAKLGVQCAAGGDGWHWSLDGAVSLPPGVEVKVWPISIAESQARALALPIRWNLPAARLTAFVAFHLSVPVKGVDDIRFTLKLPAEGLPNDRLAHVLRTLVDSPERFLRFLRALLGGIEGILGWSFNRDSDDPGSKRAWGDWFAETLLEDLVRAASRDPARLQPVRKLIEDLRTTDEGRAIVPDDLHQVWLAVDAALQQGAPRHE